LHIRKEEITDKEVNPNIAERCWLKAAQYELDWLIEFCKERVMEYLIKKNVLWISRGTGILVLAAVCYLSFSPSLVKVIDVPCIDKAEHTLAYLVLTLLGCAGLSRRVWIAPLLLFGFGVVAEFVQESIGREFSWGDMAANGAGVLLGVVIYALFCRWAVAYR